mmetsp:Transcript_17026/g.53520  ORF Transcript_17026/g.53520 Transcript_17026/m.53520 type:complete len:246 (+) Transcript_17026:1572-2309(+)
MSRGGPGSRQTSKFDEDPTCRTRISSSFAGTPPGCPWLPFSGRSTTSRFAHPMTDSRRRSGSTFRRCPTACETAFEMLWSQASASGPLKEPKSSAPLRSSSARGWRMPGATRRAAAEVAAACSPSSAATSSRRAAMPPKSTHSGNRSRSSGTPSTSAMASSWFRISLSAHAMLSPWRFFFSARLLPERGTCAPRLRTGEGADAAPSRCCGCCCGSFTAVGAGAGRGTGAGSGAGASAGCSPASTP